MMAIQSHKQKAGDKPVARFRFGHEIRPGDVIVSTVPKSIVSAAIRFGADSRFSHAAIYRGGESVLEAIGVGVTNYSIHRRGVRSKETVRVLRLRPEISDSQRIAAMAAELADNYRGRGYWIPGAILTVFGNRGDDRAGRMFCSYFVAQVYKDAGIELCPKVEPWNVTPGHLSKCEVLSDVTDTVLISIPSWQIEAVPFEAIDVEQIASPAHSRLEREREILDAANKVLRDVGRRPACTLDDVLAVLLVETPLDAQPQLDKELCEVFDAKNYGQIVPFIVPANQRPEQFCPEQMPLEVLEGTVLLHWELRSKWMNRRADYEAELSASLELSKRTGLQILLRYQGNLKLMLGLLKEAQDDLEASIEELECTYRDRTGSARGLSMLRDLFRAFGDPASSSNT